MNKLGEVISHVNISAVKNEDGGEYECIAQSRAGQAAHSARLNIYGLPYVRSMPAISTIAGKTLTIKCPAAGFPIDKIIWEKSKMKIVNFNLSQQFSQFPLYPSLCCALLSKRQYKASNQHVTAGKFLSTHNRQCPKTKRPRDLYLHCKKQTQLYSKRKC